MTNGGAVSAFEKTFPGEDNKDGAAGAARLKSKMSVLLGQLLGGCKLMM